MENYCVFATQEEADTALQTIYANMVAAIPSPDLLDVTTDQTIPQEDLTEEERAEYESDNRRFPIFGTNAATGVKNAEQGYTTAWAAAQETVDGEWVFAKPEEICTAFHCPGILTDLERIRASFQTPEDINDDPQTAPSKRITEIVPGYYKTVHGPMLTRRIGLNILRHECHHFNEWLEWLEDL